MRNWGNQGNLWFPGGFQANCRCKAKTPGKYFLSATAEAYRGWGIRAQPPLNKGTLWFPEDFFYPPPLGMGEITVYSPVCQHLFTEFAQNICRCLQNCY